ncbi:MAG: dihydropteroate synthase [Desulfobacterales bacterium]|nr:dihydropteroate synthase [Desulfobacterales bacterium]
MGKYNFLWGEHSLSFGTRTLIMGILNVTPDSFSDGGSFFSTSAAFAHGKKLVEDGADIIDIGGESSRPFSKKVSVEEECRRVLPVIEKLSKRISIPISIDTTKSEVAKRAIEAGASIINDISALRTDNKMAAVAAEYGVPVVLMHMKGTPETMQLKPFYNDVISEIKEFLENAIIMAEKNGIPRSKIIIDPGIGFGKTVEHNLLLINRLYEFTSLDAPILIGPSRKSFIRNTLFNKPAGDIKADIPALEIGTQAAVAAAVLRGADIVRVHDVAGTYKTVKVVDAIKNA